MAIKRNQGMLRRRKPMRPQIIEFVDVVAEPPERRKSKNRRKERSKHMQLAKAYDHKNVESKWYAHWMESGAFKPAEGKAPYFSMVIPPPNVTGSLHMGHALNNTLQDILCRYKRMDGYRVLWVPGTDHAGIATQNVVERRLATQGLSRTQIGTGKVHREGLGVEKRSRDTILHQLKALGVSCDWEHERFTMDEGLSLAVREAFVRLWEDSLLYRAQRLINWCPRCKTALADIEVVHEESDGNLWYIRYPLGGRSVGSAYRRDHAAGNDARRHRGGGASGRRALPTTSPAEKFACRLPDRIVPLLSDPYVDQTFGTGALKITPGHDFNDFEIGERFGLDRISIFDADARIDAAAFTSRGEKGDWIDRYQLEGSLRGTEANRRRAERKGFLEKVEPYSHAVGRCYRCQTVVEPYLTPQWFVNIKPLAEPAIQVVREGKIRIIPEGWSNSYFAWMENIKDWCISRQIWWGHQIPAWYCVAAIQANLIRGSTKANIFLPRTPGPSWLVQAPSGCPTMRGKRIGSGSRRFRYLVFFRPVAVFDPGLAP